jgi:hypothetical protein
MPLQGRASAHRVYWHQKRHCAESQLLCCHQQTTPPPVASPCERCSKARTWRLILHASTAHCLPCMPLKAHTHGHALAQGRQRHDELACVTKSGRTRSDGQILRTHLTCRPEVGVKVASNLLHAFTSFVLAFPILLQLSSRSQILHTLKSE